MNNVLGFAPFEPRILVGVLDCKHFDRIHQSVAILHGLRPNQTPIVGLDAVRPIGILGLPLGTFTRRIDLDRATFPNRTLCGHVGVHYIIQRFHLIYKQHSHGLGCIKLESKHFEIKKEDLLKLFQKIIQGKYLRNYSRKLSQEIRSPNHHSFSTR